MSSLLALRGANPVLPGCAKEDVRGTDTSAWSSCIGIQSILIANHLSNPYIWHHPSFIIPHHTDMMAADGSQRTYLHDSHGPRVVDAGQSRGAPRRHPKDSGADDREAKRSRRTSTHKSTSKPDSGHKRKSSNPQSSTKSSSRPNWELDIIGQPGRVVPLGMEVETSVMVSLRYPSAERAIEGINVDITRLIAVASLVADTRGGERVPVEPGMLTGQKQFDSVHEIPEEHVETMARSQPSRLALGYFTFPGLLIRQSGSYRLRVTLFQMPASGSSQQGPTSILSVDSETIKVERRPINPQRTHSRPHA